MFIFSEVRGAAKKVMLSQCKNDVCDTEMSDGHGVLPMRMLVRNIQRR